MTRVVALGGGHGLAATLGAVRQYASDITAIVSVADDGGSSGRLRQALGMPPPGDLRRCLVALADPQSLLALAFEHRFGAGELEGHALGNLVIAGLFDVTGDFTLALDEAGRLLGAAGRVLPATCEPVVLKANVEGPEGGHSEEPIPQVVEGQVAVANASRITSVSLAPADPPPPRAALAALRRAEQIVIGPGSLFTSILAVVAVPALREALAEAPGRKVYVCNLREQLPETSGYDVAAHVSALRAHGLEVDVVLCHPGALPRGNLCVACVERPVADPTVTVHDPSLLARALAELVSS